MHHNHHHSTAMGDDKNILFDSLFAYVLMPATALGCVHHPLTNTMMYRFPYVEYTIFQRNQHAHSHPFVSGRKCQNTCKSIHIPFRPSDMLAARLNVVVHLKQHALKRAMHSRVAELLRVYMEATACVCMYLHWSYVIMWRQCGAIGTYRRHV